MATEKSKCDRTVEGNALVVTYASQRPLSAMLDKLKI